MKVSELLPYTHSFQKIGGKDVVGSSIWPYVALQIVLATTPVIVGFGLARLYSTYGCIKTNSLFKCLSAKNTSKSPVLE